MSGKEILAGKHFLVVEDEEINWFLLRDILQNFKASAVWAEVGQKALDLVSEGNRFDAVLMDINLPVMDGLETTRKLIALRPDLPIIAQTAFALNEEISHCYKAGCIAHVCKPFTIPELVDTLVRVFDQEYD